MRLAWAWHLLSSPSPWSQHVLLQITSCWARPEPCLVLLRGPVVKQPFSVDVGEALQQGAQGRKVS